MPNFSALEPAIIPQGKPTFLLDWELTMKCNLSCGYCTKGPYGGHDNTTRHPPLDKCLHTIDFMYDYVDCYMQHKSRWGREVILNVYGGESLFHPDIVEILEAVRNKHQGRSWPLIVTTTTNLIVGPKLLDHIIPLVDEFTCSYHSENLDKQEEMFKDNLLALQAANKRFKVIVLMNPHLWQRCLDMIEFCELNKIRYLPRQLDQDPGATLFTYNQEQIAWFQDLYNQHSFGHPSELDESVNNMADQGRACCGGRQMCMDQKYKQRTFFVKDNNFKGWSCSVNWFFLYVKQLTGEVFTNKDCKMNFDSEIGPIGHLDQPALMIDYLKQNLDRGTLPVITCAKDRCLCGLCAPKAENRSLFDEIMPKYTTSWTSAGS